MPLCETCGRPIQLSAGRCMYCPAPKPTGPSPYAATGPARAVPPLPAVGAGPSESFKSTPRGTWLVVGIAAAVIGGGIVFMVATWPRSPGVDEDIAQRFAPHLAEYGQSFPPAATQGTGYIAGALLPIELVEPPTQPGGFPGEERIVSPDAIDVASQRVWQVSRAYDLLPGDLVAETPSQVGTVAQIDCIPMEVGRYRRSDVTSGFAYQWGCTVQIVDLEAGTSVATRTFTGGLPTDETVGGGSRYGSHPMDEIAAYLERLPQR